MITDLSPDAALAKIGLLRGHWIDEVVPRDIAPHSSATYAPAYAWMFTYERNLRRRIEAVLGHRLGRLERFLFGPGGVLSEGLSNAFLHGHQRRTDIPITVECAVGSSGLVFVIADRGPGFDVKAALTRLRRGGTYYRIAGNGLRALVASHNVEAGFGDQGRQLILLIPLAGAGSAPSAQASPSPT